MKKDPVANITELAKNAVKEVNNWINKFVGDIFKPSS